MMKMLLGIAFIAIAVVSSSLVAAGMYSITASVAMWGAINAALICFVAVDARAHEYHRDLLKQKAKQKATRHAPPTLVQ